MPSLLFVLLCVVFVVQAIYNVGNVLECCRDAAGLYNECLSLVDVVRCHLGIYCEHSRADAIKYEHQGGSPSVEYFHRCAHNACNSTPGGCNSKKYDYRQFQILTAHLAVCFKHVLLSFETKYGIVAQHCYKFNVVHRVPPL